MPLCHVLAALSMFMKILTLLLAALSIVSADRPVFGPEDADSYDNGTYGRTPEERFHTVDLPAYRMLRRAWNEERCTSDDKFFLGIRGKRLWHTGPVIYDNDGHQVWYTEDVKIPYNFRMQWYKGAQYLTWWSGDDDGGHGSGFNYMYDNHYRLYKRVSAHGNFSADMHEFLITPQGTAILTIYDRIYADLSSYGVTTEAESYIADCVFQEIDLETDELLFEWRASKHFAFDDCFNEHSNKTTLAPSVPPPGHVSTDDEDHSTVPLRKPRAWDWFHINSVTKDHLGNYLISSRYSHSLAYISHVDGSIQWQLGGKNNDFTDISPQPYSGYATSLAWQHHVQLDASVPNVVLVFDNQAVNWNKTRAARVLKIRLDITAMTAEVIAAAEHPEEYIVPSQGSVQQLPSGNLFVGYGFASAFTEFSPDGAEVLCDWQYGALHAKLDGQYSAGIIQSYRAFKQPWKGWPLDVPKVKMLESEESNEITTREADAARRLLDSKQTRMYISWNGATEVKTWVLERRLIEIRKRPAKLGTQNTEAVSEATSGDTEKTDNDIRPTLNTEDSRVNASGWDWLDSTPRMGFESSTVIQPFPVLLDNMHEDTYDIWQSLKEQTEYRLRAIDAQGRILGLWHVDHENNVEELPYKQDDEYAQSRLDYSASHTLALVGLVLCLILGYAWQRRRRLRRHWAVYRSTQAQNKEKGDEAATLMEGSDSTGSNDGDDNDKPNW